MAVRPRGGAANRRNGTDMSENTVSIDLPEDLRARLEALAEREGKSLGECLSQAVAEFIETWEDYHRTVRALESGEDDDRPHLRAIND